MSSELLLGKCYANIIWTGAYKSLPILCSPRGEHFEMGQGFHCEPMIVFQTVWGSGGARKCMWGFLPSSAQSCGQQAVDAAPSVPAAGSSVCAREHSALACIECLKCLQPEKIQWNGRMCISVLSVLLSALLCLFLFLVLSFDWFSSPWQ